MKLIDKYNVAVPRYTSYPTLPYWENRVSQEQWKQSVKETFLKTNDADGISIYIHLPFCDSLCTYCACNTRITVNHGVEEPYINALLKEWSLYLDLFKEVPRIRELHLGGGTPTFFSASNLKKLISGLLTNAAVCDDAEFSFEGHPNNTSKEHLKTLYDLGFRRVSFGVQDLDEKVQLAINRIQPLENVQKVVAMAREIGYTSINFDLVYGLPFQEQAKLLKTIQSVIELKPERIAFYSYAHVPWLKPGQRKFTERDLPDGVQKRMLYESGLNLFKAAGYHDVGMDHFALASDSLYKAFQNKTLHRNFMGYTSNYTELMIGLGASSISDTWDAFAQNIKEVEAYTAAVNKNTFPIFKGHCLSNEDKIVRKHILNLMCQYQTTWEKDSYNFSVLQEGVLRCIPLEEDGLLNLIPGHLYVTEAGKSFLRNICLCFDKRYWQTIPKEGVFSKVA
ncbi:oxygen-independent coproporphyrinogen III oxidase [Sphingobacteriaceae bacterium]|nr:oxygen-independent coproporphyrinogen III oxidase [Sphingobacteriaceae bacterium]